MSGGGGGDGPGAPLWIISFADMIANLLIFFIVLATFASKNTEENSVPKKVLDRDLGMFGTAQDREQEALVPRPGHRAHGATVPEAASKRKGSEAEGLRTKIQDKQYNVAPSITKLKDGVRIALEETGVFAAGSDEISEEGKEVVAEVGRFFKDEPVDLVVEAHTDDRSFRFSHHDSDVALSRAMAVAVATVLVRDAGIEAHRIGISPFGAERPVEPNLTAAGRAKNRRVEIVARERP